MRHTIKTIALGLILGIILLSGTLFAYSYHPDMDVDWDWNDEEALELQYESWKEKQFTHTLQSHSWDFNDNKFTCPNIW